MKIAFKGFRGFGENMELIEISDLTILTGKNSSGKSTFLKLLKLMTDEFSRVSSIYELTKIKINIAVETIGGKENLKSLQEVTEAKWIFSTNFEFYIDYHEIHIVFDISDYIMKVDRVEVYDELSLKNNRAICFFNSEIVKTNVKYLYSKYNNLAYKYNIFEEYRIRTEPDFPEDVNTYVCQFDEIRKDLNLTDQVIKEEIKNHISPSDVNSNWIIEDVADYGRYDYNHPFKIVDVPDGFIGNYHILWIADESIEYTYKEIEELINKSEFKNEIDEYISEVRRYDPSFDFINSFLNLYDKYIERFILSSNNFEYGTMTSEISETLTLFKYYDQVFSYSNEEEDIELFCAEEFFNTVKNHKIHLMFHLARGTALIFNEYIVSFIKSISDIEFISNIREVPERSFNIFNSISNFSSFIKHWRILGDKEREFKLKFLNKYLCKFEIADEITVEFKNNIGFIQLLKNGNKFAIIDEGSGISNIVSCLLFIAHNISNKRILVFEEPEANLHPSLQSLLADLFVDIINSHEVQIIIETHSEYLIRKLQYLIATGVIKNTSTTIYYFNLEYEENAPYIDIRKIPILQDGTLEDEFGPGFFDEANNLSINLFQFNHNQKN